MAVLLVLFRVAQFRCRPRAGGTLASGDPPSNVHLFSFHACLTELVVREEGCSAYKVALFFCPFCRLGWTLFTKRIAVFWVGRKCLQTSPSVLGSPDPIDHDKAERLVLRAAPISPSRYLFKQRQEICTYVYIIKESLCIFEFSNLSHFFIIIILLL